MTAFGHLRRLGALALACCLPAALEAQRDTTVVAGAHYRAGGLRQTLLGKDYRYLWTQPVRVPVLNPDTFAGGLTVLQEGGGLSTESLRLRGRDGREYVFRSVDKDVTPSLPEELRNTLAHDVVQDMVSAKHPAAAVVVPPLLEAVGVLHAVPRLMVMPDHPFLGEHRETFRGRLGQVEVRPTADDEDDAPDFAGAEDVEGTEDVLDEIEEDPRHRVDARAFLTARLMDVLLGDWDRHADQWRWARFDSAGLRVWRPIPRDRDNALVRQNGLVASLARQVVPTVTKFGPGYGNILGLHIHASGLDRRLLSELPRETWDSVATSVRVRLTDAVIDAAVHRLPPEYHAQNGDDIALWLRSRRDALPEAAGDFYGLVSTEVDVHSTDQDEAAMVARHPDGSVEVTVRSLEGEGGGGAPFFRRRFVPAETREVRLFLHGGDDRAAVEGGSPAGGMMVRVIGGGGDDALEDRTRGGGRRTVFYDDRGDNRFEPGTGARVDTREYRVEADSGGLIGNAPPPRDWGKSFSLLTPWAGWQPNVGPVLGFGPAWTRWGFRRQPHASLVQARFIYAPLAGGVGAEVAGDWRWTNSPHRTSLWARASDFQTTRFHGFGNDTPGEGDAELYNVEQTQVRVEPRVHLRFAERATLSLGPSLKWTDPEEEWIAPTTVRGFESFTQAGFAAGALWDGRDREVDPRGGFVLRADGAAYGTDLGAPFGLVSGEAAGYASVPGSFGPTLVLRGGARRALGEFPFQEAAFVGGLGTLRGYPYERFAGDLALFGNAEVRARLGHVNLYLVGGDLGVFALADAGRVYMDGDSPGGWHTAVGGGLWLELLERAVALTYAKGDAHRVYVTLGMP